jgi:very-short-patch-repair endonuclease
MLRALAGRQHGVVSRAQLLDAGLTAKVVKGRLARGQLIPLHRGVYAVGHRRLRREGFWMAGVLAVGRGAVLSHRDAAALHGFRPSNGSRIDVTTATKAAGGPAVRIHRARSLDPQDVTTVRGIPVTTVARTLVDLADVVPVDHLAKAMDEAERLRLFDLRAIRAASARARGRRGPGPQRLARALQELEAHGTTLTRSSLEVAFQNLLRAAGLPRPETNVHVCGHEVDALWREYDAIVELDGWRYHNTRRDFERDRAGDRELTTAGYRVVRFTHADVTHRPAHVVETLRRLGL